MLSPTFHSDRTVAMQGSAVLLMMTILVTLLGALLLDRMTLARSHSVYDNTQELGLAKEALLAFAATNQRFPGFLPCPDMDFSGDGLADDPCLLPANQVAGWLPWQTLGLPPLHTRDGMPLWYAVTPGVVPATGGTSTDRLPALNIGHGPNEQAVAVVIAPGEQWPVQQASLPLSQTTLAAAQLLPINPADLPIPPGGKK